MRLPSRSVIEIIVLLKEAATCAMPIGTCFFSFLRKTFFFPVAFAILKFQIPDSAADLQSAKHSRGFTSCPALSSWRRSCVADLCACERWYVCADRVPAGRDDVAGRDSNQCPSSV